MKPIDKLFRYIQTNGYFISTIGTTRNENGTYKNTVESQSTRYILDKFNIDHIARKWILKEEPIMCGLWGTSKLALNNLVLPFYELAKDLKNFQDDGTAPNGFGAARHDQAVLTLLAYTKGLKIQRMDYTQTSPMYLDIDKQEYPFYLTWDPSHVSEKTHIYISRFDQRYNSQFKQYIKYKKRTSSTNFVELSSTTSLENNDKKKIVI